MLFRIVVVVLKIVVVFIISEERGMGFNHQQHVGVVLVLAFTPLPCRHNILSPLSVVMSFAPSY
jgi:hypothetical protein